jgi:hypothetical protein
MALLTLTLFLTLAAATGAAIFVGGQQPIPDKLAALHLTDCLPPCWIGVTPGVTTIDEARNLIEKVYNPESGFTVQFYSNGPSDLVAVIGYQRLTLPEINFFGTASAVSNNFVVNGIQFNFRGSGSYSLAFGDLLTAFGPPA